MWLPWLPWSDAAAGSAALAGAALVGRRSRRRLVSTVAPWLRESALVLGLYSLWQLAGSLSVAGTAGALGRARWVLAFERAAHLPSERSVQHAVLGHPTLVRALDYFYAVVHVPALLVFLVWLFARHRQHYPAIRNTLALLTGACLLIQLVPVAPPRMLPGFVDTGRVFGPAFYSVGGSGGIDQLSAMPSVHVGWAALVAFGVIRGSRSRWRWLVLLHPLATVFAVVATGNHFWLDGIVAVALLGLAVGVDALVFAPLRRRTASLADGFAQPAGDRTDLPSRQPPLAEPAAVASEPNRPVEEAGAWTRSSGCAPSEANSR